MSNTYESLWHNPDTGVDIIVARGSSEEYVRGIAQISQFVPYTIREYQTPEDVRADFREWRKENGNQFPNRVIVKMKWEDGDNTDKGYQVDTIALEEVREYLPGDDAVILFYAGRGIKGLLDLMKPNNGSDFVVLEVLEFYKAKYKRKLYPSLSPSCSDLLEETNI